MKKAFSLLLVLSLAFLSNATKKDLPKKGNTHIMKSAKTHTINMQKPFVGKTLLHTGRKTIKSGFFFDYCITYEWQSCGLSNPVPLSRCYARLEDAYSWSLFMYNLNVDYLSDCPEPE